MTDFSLKPSPVAAQASRYSVPRSNAAIDLFLDGNEGASPDLGIYASLEGLGPDLLRRYPNASALENEFARRLGIEAERVMVTAGGDEAIDRACRAVLAPGRRLVLPEPTFEMIARYARLSGAEIDSVTWRPGPWPLHMVLEAITPETAMIALVSPNNPTGSVATAEQLRTLAAAAPGVLILVDQAYAEFADVDLTAVALEFPNTLVIRTVSKAWGLAGLRIGYCAGHERLITWLRACGGPYPVAGVSLALAGAALESGDGAVAAFVDRVKAERAELESALKEWGARPAVSQGNFVFVRVKRSLWVREALASFGIAIRIFPGKPGLEDAVRITCPGNAEHFARLMHALRTALAPEALLFDVDGVLVDVSGSYRQAIVETCKHYGLTVAPDDIARMKAAGDANNDWVVTHRLLANSRIDKPFEAVKERFESLYHGIIDRPGLHLKETLRIEPLSLDLMRGVRRTAFVTGRPRADLETLKEKFDIAWIFNAEVCMEDAPLKPNPAPVRLALQRLDVQTAWMMGDTPDDMVAARGAGVLPIGVLAPGETDPAPLLAAGAVVVLADLKELKELLP